MADPKTNPSGQKLVKAKRIYRQGEAYICGLCHKRYRSVENAKKCLVRDAKLLEKSQPQPDKNQQRRFRCGHCQQVYSSKEAARECAAACKSKLEKETAPQESETLNDEDDLISRLENQLAAAQDSEKNVAQNERPTESEPVSPESENTDWQRGKSENNAGHDYSISGHEAVQKREESRPNRNRVSKREAIEKPERKKRVERKQKIQVPHWALKKCMKDDQILVCKRCGSEYTSVRDVIACFDIHPPPPPDQRPKVPDRMKYRTVGDQFQCRYCTTNFDSVPGVVECYDSHEEEREAKRKARDERKKGKKARPRKKRRKGVGEDEALEDSYTLGERSALTGRDDYDFESDDVDDEDDDYDFESEDADNEDDDYNIESDEKNPNDGSGQGQQEQGRRQKSAQDEQMGGDWKSRKSGKEDYDIDGNWRGEKKKDYQFESESAEKTGDYSIESERREHNGLSDTPEMRNHRPDGQNDKESTEVDPENFEINGKNESETTYESSRPDSSGDDEDYQFESGQVNRKKNTDPEIDANWKSKKDDDEYKFDSSPKAIVEPDVKISGFEGGIQKNKEGYLLGNDGGPFRKNEKGDYQSDMGEIIKAGSDGYVIDASGKRYGSDKKGYLVDSNWTSPKDEFDVKVTVSDHYNREKDPSLNSPESNTASFPRRAKQDDGYSIESDQVSASDDNYKISSQARQPTRPEDHTDATVNRAEPTNPSKEEEEEDDPYGIAEIDNIIAANVNEDSGERLEERPGRVQKQGERPYRIESESRKPIDGYVLESAQYRIPKKDEEYHIESAATGWDRSEDGYRITTSSPQMTGKGGYRLFSSGRVAKSDGYQIESSGSYSPNVDDGYEILSEENPSIGADDGYQIQSSNQPNSGAKEGYQIQSAGNWQKDSNDGYQIESGSPLHRNNDGYSITSTNMGGKKEDGGYQIESEGGPGRKSRADEGYRISSDPSDPATPSSDTEKQVLSAAERKAALGKRFLNVQTTSSAASEIEIDRDLPQDVAFSDYTDLREFGFGQIIAKPDEAQVPGELEARRRYERRMFLRVGIKYQCKACGSRYYTKGEVTSCFDRHHNQEAIQAKPVATPKIPAEAPVEQTQEVTKEYKRDGAKYVCRACGKYYFTKKQVIACFENESAGEEKKTS